MTEFSKLIKSNPYIVDRYKLIELLNTGGRGAVFKAKDKENGKYVAIKVLFLENEIETHLEITRHFLAGSRLTMNMSHTNLVKTIDVGEDEKWGPFQIMEYLKGTMLSAAIKKQPTLPSKTVISIGNQLASVINYIHNNGMLHGDIKPENLFLLKKDGEVKIKLLDFLPRRRLQDWVGIDFTPEYLAPEAFSGNLPDLALDHFAMGVLLFEISYGKLPTFHSSGSLDFPKTKKKISKHLKEILKGLLSFNPESRNITFNKEFIDPLQKELTFSSISQEAIEGVVIKPFEDADISDSINISIEDYKDIDNLLLSMVDRNPLPQLLLNNRNQIIYLNETAKHIMGKDQNWHFFGKTPLAFNSPILLNDIQDAFELVKITSRTINLCDTKTTVWTVPIIDGDKVAAVQMILSPHV
jgi:serine/threonine protein kinase